MARIFDWGVAIAAMIGSGTVMLNAIAWDYRCLVLNGES